MASLIYQYIVGQTVFYIAEAIGVREGVVTEIAATIIPGSTTIDYTVAYKNSAYGSVVTTDTLGIATLGTLFPGSGYVPGVYSSVPLTGGTGAGATANINVDVTGIVEVVSIVNAGAGYIVGDSLSANEAYVGGTSTTPFSVLVATVQQPSLFDNADDAWAAYKALYIS